MKRIRTTNVIKGWRYYNHAMVPEVAPHEEVDIEPVKNGEIWNNRNRPLIVRWTSDWDCGFETNWWFVIKERPFEFADLSSSARRNIRRALRNCRVEKIDPTLYSEDLWRVFNEAVQRYENYETNITRDEFINQVHNKASVEEYWGGFDNKTGLMIGYAIFIVHENWVKYHKSRYSTAHLKLRVSDAINARVLEYYLNEKKKWYVSDGTRSILHKTNFQTYLIEHFGYRKAYCQLHLKYRYSIKILVDLLYPFRGALKAFDSITAVHKLNALMEMQEIVRNA